MRAEIKKGNVWFGKSGRGVPRLKHFLASTTAGLTPHTLWRAPEVGTTNDAKKQILALFPDVQVFDTPKPEKLLRRILEISTNANDLILDPYLGSGTSAAVAAKLGRRFLGIEMGMQAVTHCARRLKLVANGVDQGVTCNSLLRENCHFSFYRPKSRRLRP